MASASLVACESCDLLQRLGEIPEGATALCVRCGGVLRRRRRNSIERTLALTLAASVLFVVANSFPFLPLPPAGGATPATTAPLPPPPPPPAPPAPKGGPGPAAALPRGVFGARPPLMGKGGGGEGIWRRRR